MAPSLKNKIKVALGTKLLKNVPSRESYVRLAKMFIRQGHPELAMACFNSLILRYPSDTESVVEKLSQIKRNNIPYPWLSDETVAGIETYVMFIGYPGSGHSVVGSLIDAHPQAVIAHEADMLSYIEQGFDERAIFDIIFDNSKTYSENGRYWNDFNYNVPNQWQGRYRDLKIIGDKKGGASAIKFGDQPELVDKLLNTIKRPVKFIHVIRHPFDNIANMAVKGKNPVGMERAIERYFYRARNILALHAKLGDGAILDVHHSDVIANPQASLKDICQFLNLPTDDAYRNDCASILHASPSRTRDKATWTSEVKADIQRQIDAIAFLQRYTFEN